MRQQTNVSLCSDVGGEGCEPCVVIHPLDSPDNDPTLVGTYRYSKLEDPNGITSLRILSFFLHLKVKA